MSNGPRPPPQGFDAAVNESSNKRGLGAIRDQKWKGAGAAFASPRWGSFSVLTSYCWSLNSLRSKKESFLLWKPALLLSWWKWTAQKLRNLWTLWIFVGLKMELDLVEDIKLLITTCNVPSIVFQPRECNHVAHVLVKFILDESIDFQCIEHDPEWLMKSLSFDFNGCNLLSLR